MRRALFALSLAALSAPALVTAQMGTPNAKAVQAGTYQVDPGHTQVVWSVMHLGFNVYNGIFGNPTGSLTIDPAKPNMTTVTITFPVAEVVTTSAKLNDHLRAPDFFDAAKFPTATFKSTAVAVTGTHAKISGNLTLKGVTKPIVLDAVFTGAGAHPMSKAPTIGFEATGKIKRSDFGVSYGVPMVGEMVDLKITAAFEKKS